MPAISFYILPAQAEHQRLIFACKLIEKAYRTGHKIYIFTASEKQSRQLDDHLWSFRAGSFVPHQVYSGALPAIENPVLIGTLEPPQPWQGTIINLSMHVPESLEQSQRLLEIPDSSFDAKQAARNRYRHYQQLGWEITTHKL